MNESATTEFMIEPPAVRSVPTTEGKRFPVGRIFCVGRNYAGHAREMGHDPDREPPFFFAKPASALVVDGADAAYPPASGELHFELELVVAIGRGGRDLDATSALTHVWGYGVGLDLTRRDLQAEAKKLGRPWDMAKGFDASAPVGTLAPAAGVDSGAGLIELRVNGEMRQSSDLDQMIWRVPEIVAELSHLIALEPGDLVFTGTPEGVGEVSPGDRLVGTIAGVGEVVTTIGERLV